MPHTPSTWSQFDGRAIAALYDYPCLMVGPSGFAAGLEPAHAEEGVAAMRQMYAATGFRRAAARVLDDQSLPEALRQRVHVPAPPAR